MKNPYTRLPGRRWLSFGLVHQLWLGADHLLAIANNRYAETYQRFDFRDVQALISRRTRRRLAISLMLGIPAALGLLAGAMGGWSGVAVSLVFAGPLLLAVLANVLRGPTCVTHLRTAVSAVELPSLARVRSFERAVRILRPRLEAAQGSLSVLEIEQRLAQLPQAPQVAPPAAIARPALEPRPYRGVAHDLLFALLVTLGLVGVVRSAVSSPALAAFGGALLLGVVVALVAALVRQQETDLAPGVKRVVWAAIALVVSSFILFYGVMITQAVRHAGDKPGEDPVLRYLVGSADAPAGLMSIALALIAICVGAVGALRLRAFRSARRQRRATPLHR